MVVAVVHFARLGELAAAAAAAAGIKCSSPVPEEDYHRKFPRESPVAGKPP